MNVSRYENEWPSPIGNALAKWKWGGEMGMGGQEWGWLTVTGLEEIKGALPEILWAQDGQFFAFVQFHVEDVPTRQGAEGFSFRVGLIRMADRKLRYCLGDGKLSAIQLKSLDHDHLEALVGGKQKRVLLDAINWEGVQ